MNQYLSACQHILKYGTRKTNRTGIDAISVHGMIMKFDLTDGFPAVTTKALAFKSVVAELLGFIRGCDNAAQFREPGTGIWDANANENAQWLANPHRRGTDDLGRIYGVQWRRWHAGHGVEIDQLADVVEKIKRRVDDRRLIVTAWNPGELDQMALPPCHDFFQFGIEGEALNLSMYQRSCDFALGVPFNIASYALLLEIMARITGMEAGTFTWFGHDCHIYTNHVTGIKQQLHRIPQPLPTLVIDPDIKTLSDVERATTADFFLQNYSHCGAIAFPMAV